MVQIIHQETHSVKVLSLTFYYSHCGVIGLTKEVIYSTKRKHLPILHPDTVIIHRGMYFHIQLAPHFIFKY